MDRSISQKFAIRITGSQIGLPQAFPIVMRLLQSKFDRPSCEGNPSDHLHLGINNMKRLTSTVAAAGLAMTMLTTPVQANSDTDKVAAGALLLLGVAALAHHQHNHPDGQHEAEPENIADWDRGFSDGLHNYDYDSARSSVAYGEGYDSGKKERDDRTAQHRRDHGEGPNAPALAMKSCVGEASEKWGLRPHHIHVVKTKQAGNDDFFVEVKAGHKHGNCEVNSQGEIFLFKNGRI